MQQEDALVTLVGWSISRLYSIEPIEYNLEIDSIML